MTNEELNALPENIRNQFIATMKENERLKAEKAKGPKGITPKVSAKGAVSTYGLGRWPVTLYLSQLASFAEGFADVLDFAVSHGAELTVKEGEDREALLQRVKDVRERISAPAKSAE